MLSASYNNRKVWITGASSGIGEALAVAFHRAGAKLIISSRREDELRRVQSLCGGEADIRILPMDVTRADELPARTREALGMFGGLDILVLNAGVSQRALVKDTGMDVYRSIMETNFFGPVGMTRAVLPSMLEKKSGHIVVISSLVGKFSTPLRFAGVSGFYQDQRQRECAHRRRQPAREDGCKHRQRDARGRLRREDTQRHSPSQTGVLRWRVGYVYRIYKEVLPRIIRAYGCAPGVKDFSIVLSRFFASPPETAFAAGPATAAVRRWSSPRLW